MNEFKEEQKTIDKVLPPVYHDLAKADHLLIAGCSGSGKTVTAEYITYARLQMWCEKMAEAEQNTAPADYVGTATFLLYNPKFPDYEYIDNLNGCIQSAPHSESLMTEQADVMLSYLQNALAEMDNRLEQMHNDGTTVFPPYYIVMEEMAEMTFGKTRRAFYGAVKSLTRYGVGVNMHLIVCTQRPSRRILPCRLIRCFANRLALLCSTAEDSERIVGVADAEQFTGHGKGILKTPAGTQTINLPLR